MRISDWSSDVCSSDLELFCTAELEVGRYLQLEDIGCGRLGNLHDHRMAANSSVGGHSNSRAEFAVLVGGDWLILGNILAAAQQLYFPIGSESCRARVCQYV